MKTIPIIAVLLIAFALPVHAGLDEGAAAYARGDYAAALREFRPLAEQGFALAQYNLGFMYSKGLGLTKDEAEALTWFRKAADQGDARAQYNLGIMYAKGQGIAQDEAEAVKWYRKAAEQGDTYAQSNLGGMYANGRGVAKDEAEAVKWYRKAAEQGDAVAQFDLGGMYAEGRGVSRDYAEAMKWYRKAADQGYAHAQVNLGAMYANGQGVAKDYAEALKWYRKAAEQGDARAQYTLGGMYEKGQGVAKDEGEALKWFRKAANQRFTPPPEAPIGKTRGIIQGAGSAASDEELLQIAGQGRRYTVTIESFASLAAQSDINGLMNLLILEAGANKDIVRANLATEIIPFFGDYEKIQGPQTVTPTTFSFLDGRKGVLFYTYIVTKAGIRKPFVIGLMDEGSRTLVAYVDVNHCIQGRHLVCE